MKHHYLNPGNAFRRLLDEYHQYGTIVVAVDFDNTLYDYHQNGLDCAEVIHLLQNLKQIGCTIIIWTASEEVAFIRKYCSDNAVPVDLINENPAFFKSASRKIYYNELLDDRAGLSESFLRLTLLYQVISRKSAHPPTVFLGGTCNGSTWRETLIPMLKINCFNPVTTVWTREHQQNEKHQRAICEYCLYTITPKMTGVFSIAEAVEDSIKHPQKTILCLLKDDDGHQFSPDQWQSLTAVAALVQDNGAQVFYSLQETARHLNPTH